VSARLTSTTAIVELKKRYDAAILKTGKTPGG
jgi:hypothetical protein